MRQVVSLGFSQNHGHWGVLNSRLTVLGLLMGEPFFQSLSEVWGGEGKLLFSSIGCYCSGARSARPHG